MKYKHGNAIRKNVSKLYKRYIGIKTRCYNSNSKDYKRYGARGITVCNEWLNDFSAFERWALTNGYDPSLQINRKNNDLGYSPENCEWITPKTNCRNRRSNTYHTFQGETKTQAEWAEDKRCVVDLDTLEKRIQMKWPFEDCLIKPKRIIRKKEVIS